jgi:hypothetical protein
MLPEPIMLNMAIRGESDKQKCSATEMLMSAVTTATTSGTLCMRGVRLIIVEEDMDHPLIGRPVVDEIGFVASQHLDSVGDKFHLDDFSHIGEEQFEIGKQPLGALPKLLLKPSDIPEYIEELPDVLPLTKGKNLSSSSRYSQACFINTSVDCSGAKIMTGTMTYYSPTSNLRVSRISRSSMKDFLTMTQSTTMM